MQLEISFDSVFSSVSIKTNMKRGGAMNRFSRRLSAVNFLLVIGFIWLVVLAYLSFVTDKKEQSNKKSKQTPTEREPLFDDFDDDFAELPKKIKMTAKNTKIKVTREYKSDDILLPPLPPKIIELHKRLNLTNPGHMGAPVILPSDLPFDIQEKVNQSWEVYAINEFVSNLIPLYRELPDIRPDYCRTVKYSANLPDTSVIMVFHNEPFTMILRSVFAVLKRTPAELLKEILLVDDCSDKGLLKLQPQRSNLLILSIHLSAIETYFGDVY